MILKTYKVKHDHNIDPVLFIKARQVADFALTNGMCTTVAVKHIGLKSAIANQIIRKYARNKTIKEIRKPVKLIIPGQRLCFDKTTKSIKVLCLDKLTFSCWFSFDNVVKVNQVELDDTWAYVIVSLEEKPVTPAAHHLGIDLNSTSHSIVVADPTTGKVRKLGRQIPFLKKKYRAIRTKLQKQGKFGELKRVGRREHNKTVDYVRKAVSTIVKDAQRLNRGIKIENLKGIRKRCTKKYHTEHNHTLNSWPFFMFRTFLTQKAKELGVELTVIDPKWTSQQCSRCSHIAKENRVTVKQFVCTKCAHVDHADVNAAFNIASRSSGSIPVRQSSPGKGSWKPARQRQRKA